METQLKVDHKQDNIGLASGVDNEKMLLLGREIIKRASDGQSQNSQILENIVKLCDDPMEIAYLTQLIYIFLESQKRKYEGSKNIVGMLMEVLKGTRDESKG